MARLSKREAKLHREACDLVALERDLTPDEKDFVLEHWQESATNINNLTGAFFTPEGLARDLSIEVGGARIIDLCAGIGTLATACIDQWGQREREFVCVERNPEYVAVGRKVLPEATWICADLFDVLDMNLGRFDCAISNPPFGRIAREGHSSPRYKGSEFEYHVIDIAAHLAAYGVFIIPQASAPFRYSGRPCFEQQATSVYKRFAGDTGIHLEPNCGIDTTVYADDWHGVLPLVEIVIADFEASGAGVIETAEPTLFEQAS